MVTSPTVAPDATKGASIFLVSRQKESCEVIFFYLETTRRGHGEILPIAAKTGNETCWAYVTPTHNFIPSHITDLTGISMRDRNMFHKGKKSYKFINKRCPLKLCGVLTTKYHSCWAQHPYIWHTYITETYQRRQPFWKFEWKTDQLFWYIMFKQNRCSLTERAMMDTKKNLLSEMSWKKQ